MHLGSGIRDPGSGKNLFRIPGSKRHRIPDPDPQHWYSVVSHTSGINIPWCIWRLCFYILSLLLLHGPLLLLCPLLLLRPLQLLEPLLLLVPLLLQEPRQYWRPSCYRRPCSIGVLTAIGTDTKRTTQTGKKNRRRKFLAWTPFNSIGSNFI